MFTVLNRSEKNTCQMLCFNLTYINYQIIRSMSPVRTPMSSSTKSGGSGLSPRITEANLARNNNNQSSNLSEDTNKYGPFSRYVFILTMDKDDNNNNSESLKKNLNTKEATRH